MLKQSFRDYIFSTNTDGDGKVASYVRALDMLGTILTDYLPRAWAEDEKNRLNPENGLCLSATYDAAFDRHLISFDEHYRLVISKAIKDHYTDAAAKSYFLDREGQTMSLPTRFLPSQSLLEKHRELVTGL